MQFSGWTANWGKILKRLDHELHSADVLILMRFTRTMLGRAVRKRASEQGLPWVACTGHGRQSLQRAIEEAVRVAARPGRGEVVG